METLFRLLIKLCRASRCGVYFKFNLWEDAPLCVEYSLAFLLFCLLFTSFFLCSYSLKMPYRAILRRLLSLIRFLYSHKRTLCKDNPSISMPSLYYKK